MRAVILALVAACGAAPPPPVEQVVGPPIVVEWKVEAGDGDRVNVTLVVDGKALALGSLATTTEDAVGPATCALRAAHPLRTELMCGDANYYVAELVGGELVITLVDGEHRAPVQRVPVTGERLVVKALRF